MRRMEKIVEVPDGDLSLEETMDSLSLEQALLDFEVANARVMDLTRRLVDATAAISELNTELQQVRIDHARLKAEHEQMRSSQAFRIAERIWALRNATRI
jgi:hypothetical protein